MATKHFTNIFFQRRMGHKREFVSKFKNTFLLVLKVSPIHTYLTYLNNYTLGSNRINIESKLFSTSQRSYLSFGVHRLVKTDPNNLLIFCMNGFRYFFSTKSITPFTHNPLTNSNIYNVKHSTFFVLNKMYLRRLYGGLHFRSTKYFQVHEAE